MVTRVWLARRIRLVWFTGDGEVGVKSHGTLNKALVLSGSLVMESGKGFGTQKRNFDEIDRSSFDSFIKRNFDEIDRSGFDSFAKRNFDEIDRSGFGNFVKRIYWLMSRHPAEGR
uniref:Uncharacterized protein n=1 Tax=Timema tahoe TaxID=61484 RepID=A0A7R9NU14_9NEOP|nr:unnamed protein product [Timema tahoe]